jgi:ribosomal protein S1
MENNNTTMQEMLDMMEESFKIPRKGDVLKGKVVQVNKDEIVVNIGYKSDGIVPLKEVSSDPNADVISTIEEDQEIDVYVMRSDDGEGNVLLSMKRVSMFKDWDELEEIMAKEENIEVRTSEAVKGGVVAYYKEVRGFIPASHLAIGYVKDLNEFVGKTLEVKIIEFNKGKKKIVFSRKAIEEVALRAKKAELWGKIEIGQIMQGEVKRITNFGVFVDIGGVDGLVHISELSWGRVKSPKEIVKVGDMVDVKILSADKETEKVSLSMKQVKADPWTTFADRYEVEGVYEAKVVNLTDFGAFVELEPGVEGLVHISQISHKRVEKPSDELKVGDLRDVKILEADAEAKKLKLSMKEAQEAPAEEADAE